MNALIPFTVLILSWSIDGTDPRVQQRIIYTFVAVHVVALCVFVYMGLQIYLKGMELPMVQVKESYSDAVETKKAWDYDAGKLRELLFTKIGLSAGVSLFAATRYGIVFPLLMQCMNNPKTIWDSEVFKIYVRGFKAEGPLQRPFPDKGMVPEWLKGVWNQSTQETEAMVSQHVGSSASAAAPATGGGGGRK